MTGYLHIPEPPADALREEIASRLRGSFYSSWREGASIDLASYDAADILLDFLRGLSVEPTEDGDHLLATPGGRRYLASLLSLNPTPATLAGIVKMLNEERPFAAPVPVQEDRP